MILHGRVLFAHSHQDHQTHHDRDAHQRVYTHEARAEPPCGMNDLLYFSWELSLPQVSTETHI